MYTKTIPYKDFKKNPRNEKIELQLTEDDVFGNMPLLKDLFQWVEKANEGEERIMESEDVSEFYGYLKQVLLLAWGEVSEDGRHFRRAGRYDFEESALFNAAMMSFVVDPPEAIKMLESIMPEGLNSDMVKKAADNLKKASENPENSDELKAEIAKLQAQLAEANPAPVSS